MIETVPSVRTDYALFMKTIPHQDYLLTFWEFIKVFLLGDIYALMRTSPFAASRSPVEYLEPEFQHDTELREKYFGDPVKRAMFVQALRRWPYMTAIPVIFSLSICIGSLLKLTIPFIKRITLLMENILVVSQGRKKRDLEANTSYKQVPAQLTSLRSVPAQLTEICLTLARSLEAAEYLALVSVEKEGGFRLENPRHSLLYSNHTEKSAKQDLQAALPVGHRILNWIKNWSQLSPSMTKCGEQLVRCHLSLSTKWQNSQQCQSKSECATLFGRFVSVISSQNTSF